MTKWVYSFGAGKAEGDGSWRALLGGKGAGLAEMSRIGLPVPPGFTITTEVCTYYYGNKKTYPKVLDTQVKAAVEAQLLQIHRRGHGWRGHVHAGAHRGSRLALMGGSPRR